MYCWRVQCEDGVYYDESPVNYNTEKEAYESMRNAALEKMKWNTEYDEDFEDEDSTVDYEVEFSKREIVHRSFSGRYVYEIFNV